MSNIEKALLEFHTKSSDLPFPILLEGEQFGVLDITMKKTDIVKTPLFILFTIDKTGSMMELGNTFLPKMNFVKQTFKNMISYLAKQDVEIYIRVHSFNTTVDVDIENERITEENADALCSKIDELVAESSTNIELALQTAKDTLTAYEDSYPEHQIAHVFMTDGEPTIGNQRPDDLASLVNTKFSNIFLGFGMQHNVSLMKKLAEDKMSDYQFVDNMENTGLIYGEVVHQFLYPAMKNIKICVTNGLIYDWITNQWTENIYENVFVSEAKKTYQVKSSTKELMEVEIRCYNKEDENVFDVVETVTALPDLIDQQNCIIECDLSKYIYRQQVQSALFEANKIPNIRYDLIEEFKTQRLRHIFRNMRKFMRENDLNEDPFMKVLCDDIIITFQTIGTYKSNYYSSARQSSQGRQRTYNVTTNDSFEDDQLLGARARNHIHRLNAMDNILGAPRPRRLVRQTTGPMDPSQLVIHPFPSIDSDDQSQEPTIRNIENIENIGKVDDTVFQDVDTSFEDEIDNFLPSNNNISCYATPRGLDTMRTMSCHPSDSMY
jgi:von Willebrand factor type A domain